MDERPSSPALSAEMGPSHLSALMPSYITVLIAFTCWKEVLFRVCVCVNLLLFRLILMVSEDDRDEITFVLPRLHTMRKIFWRPELRKPVD